MAHRILNEDWTDYDNRKKKKEDSLYFSCEEAWEVDYLINKIKKHWPYKTESAIREAISTCCRSVPAPRPRDVFVRCVVSKL
jgi:hypothetical protein